MKDAEREELQARRLATQGSGAGVCLDLDYLTKRCWVIALVMFLTKDSMLIQAHGQCLLLMFYSHHLCAL